MILKEIDLYNTATIQKACADAMKNNKMVGIVDYSGAGKTFGLNKFERENKGVYKIELGPSVTPKEMYVQILNKIRNEDISRTESISLIIRQIRLELSEGSGNRLIVIDEASRFVKERVSYFHELRNLTQNHCGLIISGHKDFERFLNKWASQGISGVEEFRNRFSYFINLKRPQDNELTNYFEANQLLDKKGGRELFNKILQIDKKSRTWRNIQNIIVETLR